MPSTIHMSWAIQSNQALTNQLLNIVHLCTLVLQHMLLTYLHIKTFVHVDKAEDILHTFL